MYSSVRHFTSFLRHSDSDVDRKKEYVLNGLNSDDSLACHRARMRCMTRFSRWWFHWKANLSDADYYQLTMIKRRVLSIYFATVDAI